MVSLYVCDFPHHTERKDLQDIFANFDGFIEVRIARDKNKQKIAFVDYKSEQNAKVAMNGTKQFRFPSSSKGITVRISDNTKCNVRQNGGGSQLPGSGGSRQGRRNGPLDRDQKSSAKQNSRNHGRDRPYQSGGGSGQNYQSHQQHTQGKSGNTTMPTTQSFDLAAQSHARVAGLTIDHPPQSSQSQHANNSLLLPPQSNLMTNIPTSSSTQMMTHNGSMNPNPILTQGPNMLPSGHISMASSSNVQSHQHPLAPSNQPFLNQMAYGASSVVHPQPHLVGLASNTCSSQPISSGAASLQTYGAQPQQDLTAQSRMTSDQQQQQNLINSLMANIESLKKQQQSALEGQSVGAGHAYPPQSQQQPNLPPHVSNGAQQLSYTGSHQQMPVQPHCMQQSNVGGASDPQSIGVGIDQYGSQQPTGLHDNSAALLMAQPHGGPFLTPLQPQLPQKNISDVQQSQLGMFPPTQSNVGGFPAATVPVQQMNSMYTVQNIPGIGGSQGPQEKSSLDPSITAQQNFDANNQNIVGDQFVLDNNQQNGFEFNHQNYGKKEVSNGLAPANCGPVEQNNSTFQSQIKPEKLPSPNSQKAQTSMPALSEQDPQQMVNQIRALFMKGEASDSAVDESKILPIPKNATNTVYVEGIPTDATEREVAHIFRPFVGFKTVRLIPREKRQGEKVILCFADFENTLQTTIVINTLQGYRFDRDDILGLQFSYALTSNKSQKNNQSLATNVGSTNGTNRKNSMEMRSRNSPNPEHASAGEENSRQPSPPLFPFNQENTSTSQQNNC